MAYTEEIYISSWGIEHAIHYAGRYGARGEKRAKRAKATPEQIRRQNQRNKEKRIQRTIQANFRPGDHWITLKYPKGTRKPLKEIKRDFKEFRRLLRKHYHKAGVPMKYIYRIEIGKRGGIHIHIILPRIPDGDLCISDAWMRARGMTPIEDMIADGRSPMDGMTDFTLIRAAGNGKDLAEYICKELPEEAARELTPQERRQLLAVGTSRNLVRPTPIRKRYNHWTVRRLLEIGVENINNTPSRFRTEGYLVDKNSWYQGVNPVTGMSYISYMEIPIRRRN